MPDDGGERTGKAAGHGRQTVRGKNSHCEANGKYTKHRNLSITGLKGLEYKYSSNGLSKRRFKKKEKNNDQVGGWFDRNR